MLTIKFERERETKRTVRYTETGPEHEHAVGTLYLKKEAVEQLGNPIRIAAVIGTPEEFVQ